MAKGTAATSETNGHEGHKHGPLSPEEFRSVLERIDALGLTWTAGCHPPHIRVKAEVRDPYSRDDYIKIQEEYPEFPSQLGYVIFHAPTKNKNVAAFLGEQEDIDKKVAAVEEFIINRDYRSEYFFKYAIKVPYFFELDWEVVIKAQERGVKDMPQIAYALILLMFRHPTNPALPIELAGIPEVGEPEILTVAVDEHLVDKLISRLQEVKEALGKSKRMSLSYNNQGEEKQNGTDS